MANLLSWNIRGFMNKRDEIRDLISDHRPICFALQETHLKNTDKVIIRGYSSFRRDFLFSLTEQRAVLLFLFPMTFPLILSL